jgi:hypothetical protein
MRTGIPVSSGKAAISFDFSSAFAWPIAIFSRDEYALTMHGMKTQAILLEMLKKPRRMTRGRLCVLSRGAKGGRFCHLQYRRNTELFQRHVPVGEVAAYEESTEQFRLFLSAVDAYVDEMSAKGMAETRKEAQDAKRRQAKRPRRKDG